MRTKEEIKAKKEKLNQLYKAKSTNSKSRLMVIGGVRELDWVLNGDD